MVASRSSGVSTLTEQERESERISRLVAVGSGGGPRILGLVTLDLDADDAIADVPLVALVEASPSAPKSLVYEGALNGGEDGIARGPEVQAVVGQQLRTGLVVGHDLKPAITGRQGIREVEKIDVAAGVLPAQALRNESPDRGVIIGGAHVDLERGPAAPL